MARKILKEVYEKHCNIMEMDPWGEDCLAIELGDFKKIAYDLWQAIKKEINNGKTIIN